MGSFKPTGRLDFPNLKSVSYTHLLKKAMRSYNYKDKVSAVLEQSDTYWSLDKPLQDIKLANEKWLLRSIPLKAVSYTHLKTFAAKRQ